MNVAVRKFIQTHWDGESPLLLGLSGGPDSRILLHLLTELQATSRFELAIAHVDHRWRECSAREASALQELAKTLGFKFHLKTLHPPGLKSNLEASCRDERLQFFRELCQEHGYQAVLLGHHANDHAETVLKRIFEGCSLPRLHALAPVSNIAGVTLWRPLLSIWKKDLLTQLIKLQIEAFDDATNQDPRFLRARFRTSILPSLAETFGKEVEQHLVTLSHEAQELQSYLNRQIASALENEISGPFGALLDVRGALPDEPVEQKHLIRSFAEKWGLRLSKEGVAAAASFLASGAAGKAISCGVAQLHIDRYCLFAMKKKSFTEAPPQPIKLCVGIHRFADWIVTIREVASDEVAPETHTGWLHAWKGELEAIIEAKNSYLLVYPQASRKSPRKLWNTMKVPALIRECIPLILEHEDTVAYEFLSGKIPKHHETPLWHIILRRQTCE